MKTIITAFTIWLSILTYSAITTIQRGREIDSELMQEREQRNRMEFEANVKFQEDEFIRKFHEVSKMNQVSQEVKIKFWWIYFEFGFYLDRDKIWYVQLHPYTWGYSTRTRTDNGEYKYSFVFNSYSEHIYPICFGLTSTQNDTTYFTERWEKTEIHTLKI